jgi:hypothetical protein
MPEAWRLGFVVSDLVVRSALDLLLLEHRSRIFREHFRDRMDLSRLDQCCYSFAAFF